MHRFLSFAARAAITIFTTYCVYTATSWWATIIWVAAGVLLGHYLRWLSAKNHAEVMARLGELFGQLESELRKAEEQHHVDTIVKNAIEKATRHED